MKKVEGGMRKEYDFTKGVRGKHAGQRLRIIGDARGREATNGTLAGLIQQSIELDIRSREGFDALWNTLGSAEQEEIRAAWLERIDSLLEEDRRETSGSRR